MSTIDRISACSPRQLRKHLLRTLYAQLVPFVIGSPGIGKSAIVHNVAKELNLKVIDHRLSTSAPEDLTGLPRFNEKGQAEFAPFAELFPLENTPLPEGQDGWLLFLDEFNSAHKDVQAAAYKLILDRKVGQHNLHQNVAIVAAGNKATDRAIVNKLGTAMQSRLITLELESDFREWLEDVAIKQDYDPRIISYLSQYNGRLFDFRPDHADHTFCCPRTWEFMNRLVKGQTVEDSDAPLLAGTITSGFAVEFITYCKLMKDLISHTEILKDPHTCRMPDNISLKWATVTHIMEKVTAENFADFCTYVDRMDSTMRVLFYRMVRIRKPELEHSPAYINAMVAVAKHIYG